MVMYSHQTLNGHIKKGSDSLIRLIGGSTAKWSQICDALTFLSNTRSLLEPVNPVKGEKGGPDQHVMSLTYSVPSTRGELAQMPRGVRGGGRLQYEMHRCVFGV